MKLIKTYEAWSQPFKFPTVLELLKGISKGMITTNDHENLPIFRKNQLDLSLETIIKNSFGGSLPGIKDAGHLYYDISYVRFRDLREYDYLLIFEDDEVVSIICLRQELLRTFNGLFVIGDIFVAYCLSHDMGYIYIYNISNGLSQQFSIAISSHQIPNCISEEGGEYEIKMEYDVNSRRPILICRETSTRIVSHYECENINYYKALSEPQKPISRKTIPVSEWDTWNHQIRPLPRPYSPLDEQSILISCEECNGEGMRTCSECYGAGHFDCDTCDVTGDCDTCDSGVIDCEECSDGSVECEDCGGTGEVDDETCENCDGKGKVECDGCSGNGNYECPKCDGSGDCQSCEGSGVTYCEYCDEGSETCFNCDGEGTSELDLDED